MPAGGGGTRRHPQRGGSVGRTSTRVDLPVAVHVDLLARSSTAIPVHEHVYHSVVLQRLNFNVLSQQGSRRIIHPLTHSLAGSFVVDGDRDHRYKYIQT